MSMQNEVMQQMKEAMKSKDTTALEALRALKSAFLLANTSGSGVELSEADEIKIVQKLVKQRKDSAVIFEDQGREDLAEPELAQAAVLEKFLPAQMSEEDIKAVVDKIIAETGASSMKDLGKVNWIEYQISALRVGGSNPPGVTRLNPNLLDNSRLGFFYFSKASKMVLRMVQSC